MERLERWVFPATLIAGTALLWAIAFVMMTGFEGQPNGTLGLRIAIFVIGLACLCRFITYVIGLWRAGAVHPIMHIRQDFRPAIANFLPIPIGVLVIGTFLSSITYLKSMIVAVVPFWADAPLANIDAALHISPQELGIFFQPAIVELGIFYGLWHGVELGGILWVLHWRASEEKSRLIIGFMLTWMIGMAVAYIFSSAGPIFTGRYDHALAPESMRKVVNFLWANYQQQGAAFGGGISAFPSMHVAIAAWFALALKERGLLWAGVAYTLAVFACSVILGWHYSVDGVAGVAIALVANRLARSWLRGGAVTMPFIVQPAGSLD